jgi:threonine/homoserine/homoserine lactone efflux protein
MLTASVTFALAAILIVLLPGPDTLVVLRNLMRGGRHGAALTVAGVLCGLTVWVAAAALGMAAVLHASGDAYLALRVVGAVYLIWLGVQTLRARTAPDLHAAADLPPTPTSPSGRPLLGRGFGAGLATDLLNPKVGIFFVTFLPGFVPDGVSVGSASVTFGAIFVVETAVYFGLLLFLAGRITGWMQDRTVRRWLDRATGTVLIGFGLRLAVEP